MPGEHLTVDDPNRKRFIDRLRLALGSQSGRAFAKSAGIPPTTFAKCLKGETEPTRPTLVAIARAANVSVHWLATGEGEMVPGVKADLPPARGELDLDLMRSCIVAVEELLAELGRKLDLTAKAELITLVYQNEQLERAKGKAGLSGAELIRLFKKIA